MGASAAAVEDEPSSAQVVVARQPITDDYEQATITEYLHRLPTHPNGDNWLQVITIVEDPRYLSQAYYTSTNFRLEANDTAFKPTPCQTAPPLPVKTPTRTIPLQ